MGPRPVADCGAVPTARYQDISYADGLVSPDQARIEDALGPFTGRDRALLHVGTGSSSLARRYADQFARVDGFTLLADEQAVAIALALPNYRVWRGDKYGSALTTVPGAYHVIVDNNPSSFACCHRHFDGMMATYAALLVPGGVLLTDRRGLAFAEPYAFGLSWRGWKRAGARVGLTASRITRTVWALSKSGG